MIRIYRKEQNKSGKRPKQRDFCHKTKTLNNFDKEIRNGMMSAKKSIHIGMGQQDGTPYSTKPK